MSESETHTRLIHATLAAIVSANPITSLAICADVPTTGEYPATFSIGGFRPDMYVKNLLDRSVIIGEAKSARDVDTLHTRTQLKEFLEHLSTTANGILWLSVPLPRAGEAQRVVRSVRRDSKMDRVGLVVSGWLLGKKPLEARWSG